MTRMDDSVIPLWKELEYYKEFQKKLKSYLGEAEAESVLKEALYMISLGTNDFLENYYMLPVRSAEYNIEDYQNFLVEIAGNFITELHQLGGRKISLAGLAPIGCLPMERSRNVMRGGSCIERYNDLAKEFNQKLQTLVDKLKKELASIQLVFSDPYDIFSEIIQNPSSYGYEDAGKSCCGTGTLEMGYWCDRYNPFTCRDANKFVFWDSFHATEKTNGIIADYAANHSLSVFFN
ncbi:OLC1v1022638C1 [Oldenlandia corymbosa var. corymbosa]|uniref:OLC1v1022638C1 n=1 Tax=Oldenlandia corymbosa var. corymbosa TaxID=529605 RepID=A0AAV1C140_OLDCO|nr:OLC1v1022638C1 [Oldenlandia corymbosa var. corymbosa]